MGPGKARRRKLTIRRWRLDRHSASNRRYVIEPYYAAQFRSRRLRWGKQRAEIMAAIRAKGVEHAVHTVGLVWRDSHGCDSGN